VYFHDELLLCSHSPGLYTQTASANQYLNDFLFHNSIEPFNEGLHSRIVLKQVFELLKDSYGVIYIKTKERSEKNMKNK